MFLVLLGLSIGIATIVSVYSVVEAMRRELTKNVSEFGVNVIVTPSSGGLTFSYGGITLPEIMYDVEQLTTDDLNQFENIKSRDMIRVIAPKLIGVEKVNDNDKIIVVGANIQEEFLIKPWLRIRDMERANYMEQDNQKALSNEGKMDFEALDLRRQDIETLNILDNQVIIGGSLSKMLNVKEGEQLRVGQYDMEVYGVLEESGSTEDGQILMNLPMAQKLFERQNEITVVEMAVDYSSGSEEVMLSEINEIIPHANVSSLRQEALRRDEVLFALVRFGITISLVVLLIGMLVVGITMANSVRERTREIGIFRAIGFRKTHIFKMIMIEGIAISIGGGILGFVIGVFMARYAGTFLTDMQLSVPFRVDILITSIGLAIIIGVISSLYPSYQASKQDPVEALRFI